MYKIGDVVLHGATGDVCTIKDIREEKVAGKVRTYCVLHPHSEKEDSLIYIPLEYMDKLTRSVYTPAQIDSLIAESAKSPVGWPEKATDRKSRFSDILKCGDVKQMLALICCIYEQKKRLAQEGRRLSAGDEKFLTDAQNKVHREFSYSLHISEDKVCQYVVDRLDGG